MTEGGDGPRRLPPRGSLSGSGGSGRSGGASAATAAIEGDGSGGGSLEAAEAEARITFLVTTKRWWEIEDVLSEA